MAGAYIVGYLGYSKSNKRALYHTQVNCGRLNASNTAKIVRVTRREDGSDFAQIGGQSVRMTECDDCPPPLEWDWQDRAACHGIHPAVDMLSVAGTIAARPLIEEYCDNCSVVLECAQMAVDGKHVGIWGGVYVSISNEQNASKARRKLKHAILTNPGHAA